jgi:hypothetical protein
MTAVEEDRMDRVMAERWQEWLTVAAYLTFLSIIVWRVLVTK